jgi:hypothetical protein
MWEWLQPFMRPHTVRVCVCVQAVQAWPTERAALDVLYNKHFFRAAFQVSLPVYPYASGSMYMMPPSHVPTCTERQCVCVRLCGCVGVGVCVCVRVCV